MINLDNNRLTSLDALRGMSSIGVCFFFHYVHFTGAAYSSSTYPFGNVFFWFYKYGWLMVDFFFVLSGFVFSHMYRQRISEAKISFRKYAFFRFSRLYPLSILTLFIVLVLQYARRSAGMGFFIYQMNDAFNFFINIFFLQGIVSNGWSYNAPSWAISVQLLAYALFFLVIKYLNNRRLFVYLVLIAAGIHFREWNDSFLMVTNIARVLMGFFAGCMAHDVHRYITTVTDRKRAASALLKVACIGLILSVVIMSKLKGQTSVPKWTTVYTFAVFPQLILLAVNSRVLTYIFSFRPFKLFGDISFSIYLLHFPCQLFIVSIAQIAGIHVNYYSPWFFLFFFALTSTIAYVVYNTFEKKAQERLRELYDKKFA